MHCLLVERDYLHTMRWFEVVDLFICSIIGNTVSFGFALVNDTDGLDSMCIRTIDVHRFSTYSTFK